MKTEKKGLDIIVKISRKKINEILSEWIENNILVDDCEVRQVIFEEHQVTVIAKIEEEK